MTTTIETSATARVAGDAGDMRTLPPQTRAAVVEAIVDLTHREIIGRDTGLLWLENIALTSDEQAFDEALTAMDTRDRLLDGTCDPYELLEVAPSVSVQRLREYAVGEQERDLAHAIHVLSQPAQAPA